MKGLLLKDLYMIKKYFKGYLIVIAIFIVATAFMDDYSFIMMYPCFLSGMLPVALLSYEEQSGWVRYSGALPYTKAQIVSGKYFITLVLQIIIILLIGIMQTVKICVYGTLSGGEVILFVALMFTVSCIFSSVTLPCIFKYGIKKASFVTCVGGGAALALMGSIAASSVFRSRLNYDIRLFAALPIVCIAAAAVYGLSWYLSVVFYKKREI